MLLCVSLFCNVQSVVVTYAAMAIERILAVKDRVPGQRPTPRLPKESLVPFLEKLFTGLFTVRACFPVCVCVRIFVNISVVCC